MPLFNEGQKARLSVTFKAIDESLARALAQLDPAAAHSLFSTHKPDATAEQYRLFAAATVRIREAMREFLRQNDIPLPEPTISSLWAARAALLTGIVSLEECGPKGLRGYGELQPAAARALESGLPRLRELLAQLEAELGRDAG